MWTCRQQGMIAKTEKGTYEQLIQILEFSNPFFKGDCDFKLEEFLAGTPETFEPHYGKNKIMNNKSSMQMLLRSCLKTNHF